MDRVREKTCTKCGIQKSLENFSKHSSCMYGVRSACKECSKEENRKYRAENPEKAKASTKAWRDANPEKNNARIRAWARANPEKERQKQAKWREKNKEWLATYRENNKSAIKTYNHNRRVREISNGGRLSSGIADRLFILQKGKCACCGAPLGKDFHIDHIMPIILGGANTDDNVQLLRKKCNHQKHSKHPVDFMQSRGFLL